jgi:hypothetical protein
VHFSRIVLENWRNFVHVDVALQSRAFLVGPNASGKSNFLDVFRFLRDLVIPGGGFEQAVNSRGGFLRILNMFVQLPSYPGVVIQVEIPEAEGKVWVYRIAFGEDVQQRPVLLEEKVWLNGELLLDRPNDDDAADPKQLRQTHLEQNATNRKFRPIADFFESINYFHLIPQLVRDPNLVSGRENDPYGSDFLKRLARTPAEVRQERLARIMQALALVAPQVVELELKTDARGVSHLRGRYRHGVSEDSQVGYSAWYDESDFSDGTLRLIGLLWSLLEGSGPLLLEEPELSLHSEVIRYIPLMMWRVQSQKDNQQILLSTHSSELLRDEGIAADEVLLFRPVEEGTAVQAGNDIEEVRRLMDTGLAAAEVAMTYTQPRDAILLALWGD